MFELVDICRDEDGRVVGVDIHLAPVVFVIVFVALIAKWSAC